MGGKAFTVVVEDNGHELTCGPDDTVLVAMERAGLKAIPVGCRGGGCGACRVQVVAGKYRLGKMSRAHVTTDEERQGFALACRLFPESDLRLRCAARIVESKKA